MNTRDEVIETTGNHALRSADRGLTRLVAGSGVGMSRVVSLASVEQVQQGSAHA